MSSAKWATRQPTPQSLCSLGCCLRCTPTSKGDGCGGKPAKGVKKGVQCCDHPRKFILRGEYSSVPRTHGSREHDSRHQSRKRANAQETLEREKAEGNLQEPGMPQLRTVPNEDLTSHRTTPGKRNNNRDLNWADLNPSKDQLGTTKIPQHSTSQPFLLKDLAFLWRRRRLRCRNAQEEFNLCHGWV